VGYYAKVEPIEPIVGGRHANAHAGYVYTELLMLLVMRTSSARSEAKVQLSFRKLLALSWSLRTRSGVPVALKCLAIDNEMLESRTTVGFAVTMFKLASTMILRREQIA